MSFYKGIKMQTKLMNMVMIKDGDRVLALDKVKKYGWEGITFPGGKVEEGESLTDSVIREAKEETNLDIKNPRLVGMITWIVEGRRDMGFIYETSDFSGELVEENREGRLFWTSYEEMKEMDGLSESMDKIFMIYDKKAFEITWFYDEGRVIYQ